jgi:hypothetical protein
MLEGNSEGSCDLLVELTFYYQEEDLCLALGKHAVWAWSLPQTYPRPGMFRADRNPSIRLL